MNLLLDTHTFLWFITGNESLSKTAREIIENEENQIYLSAASLWEMAIKISLGKLELSEPFEPFVTEQLSDNSLELLGVSISHITKVASLPFHHRDPFDRMLASQALAEDIPIISVDAIFDEYNVKRIW